MQLVLLAVLVGSRTGIAGELPRREIPELPAHSGRGFDDRHRQTINVRRIQSGNFCVSALARLQLRKKRSD